MSRVYQSFAYVCLFFVGACGNIFESKVPYDKDPPPLQRPDFGKHDGSDTSNGGADVPARKSPANLVSELDGPAAKSEEAAIDHLTDLLHAPGASNSQRFAVLKWAVAANEVVKKYLSADILKMSGVDENAQAFVKATDFVEVRRLTNQSGGVLLKPTRSTEITMYMDTDPGHTCWLLDRTLPVQNKVLLSLKNAESGKVKKLAHPFGGKACSAEALSQYKTLNFYGNSGDIQRPEMVLMAPKDHSGKSAYAFFQQSNGPRSVKIIDQLKLAYKEPADQYQKTNFSKAGK